jgi:8-oxo-dGTP pyrophosphatase MutT (NUDIX family)
MTGCTQGQSTIQGQGMPFHTFDTALRQSIGDRIAGFVPARIERTGLRRAAVTIVIAPQPQTGHASVIVTLRPDTLRRHGAQYALPGGRLDDGETEIEAALRETSEELGLDLDNGDILGRLDDFPTRSGFRMTPFVAWCPDAATLAPDPSEVADVFFLPLAELDSDDIPILEPGPHGEHPVMSAFFPTLGHRMFAPTAAILYQFREIALRAVTTRVSHFEQPTFAWK